MKARLDRPGGNTQCRGDLIHRQILAVKEVHRYSLLRRQLPDPSRDVDPMLHTHSCLARACADRDRIDVKPSPAHIGPNGVGTFARRDPVEPGWELSWVAQTS